MKIVLAIIGTNHIVTEDVVEAETMREVIIRVLARLKINEREDLVVVHEVGTPLPAADPKATRMLEKVKLPNKVRQHMQEVSMSCKFRTRDTEPKPNKIDYLVDIPQRSTFDPFRVLYASDRRYKGLKEIALIWCALFISVAGVCLALASLLPNPIVTSTLRYCAAIFVMSTGAAVVLLLYFYSMSKGRNIQV